MTLRGYALMALAVTGLLTIAVLLVVWMSNPWNRAVVDRVFFGFDNCTKRAERARLSMTSSELGQLGYMEEPPALAQWLFADARVIATQTGQGPIGNHDRLYTQSCTRPWKSDPYCGYSMRYLVVVGPDGRADTLALDPGGYCE